MNKKDKRKQHARTTSGETNAFTPDQIKAIEEATRALREGFPWLEARPEAQIVAMRATFPRSVAGDKQDDLLLRRIWIITQIPCDDIELTRRAIVETVNAGVATHEEFEVERNDPPLFRMVYELGELHDQPPQPKTNSEFFYLIAERLKHLETYEPTAGDYAVEALQNAFVGLMQRTYDWGKKGYPTKGEVSEMAKRRLKRLGEKSDFSKSYWSDLLQVAGFGDWLLPGRAGRPSKSDVDENIKAERKCMALFKQEMRKTYGDNWIAGLSALRAARGSKAEYRRSQEQPLRAS